MCIKKVCAVIPAAGSGKRMGGVSKPNIKISGKTLFEYVIEAFDGEVESIAVVCSADNEASLRALATGVSTPVSFVRGGSERAFSVYNGILSQKSADIICVHDCARPFVTKEMIRSAVEAAKNSGASCVCSPVVDTIKQRDLITGAVSTPARESLFAVQTPQCFEKSLYIRAYEYAKGNIGAFTDETSLLENAGINVEYINRTETNMKITAYDDVPTAEIIMNRRRNTK